MQTRYKPSYYNLKVAHDPWVLLFNGVSSGLMRLPKDVAEELDPFLGSQRPRDAGKGLHDWDHPSFAVEELPPSIAVNFESFLDGQFFLPAEEDETINLRTRYEHFRRTSPFLITLTTTMDCNLGCYYCYEDKSKVYLSRETCDEILKWIQKEVDEKGHSKLYTDWYGGEPMLNQGAIEYFSERAISFCEDRGISYSSAMISNGTLWPEDAQGFVHRNRIRHVQFTLDGPPDLHNRRRRYVSKDDADLSSFDEITKTIDRLIGAVRIYLRINVDPWVGRNALSLVEFFHERGWFEHGSKFYPYLASVGPMTEHCSFLGASEKVRSFQDEFDWINHEFQAIVGRYIDPRGIQHLQYYPTTIKINCAAVGDNSVVFGPDGLMYKCGLDVGDAHKAHDSLVRKAEVARKKERSQFVILNNLKPTASPTRWDDYDPFTHTKCSQCQYLPICMGGCPKAQIERDNFYLDLQSKYWEDNFDTVIKTYYETAVRNPLSQG